PGRRAAADRCHPPVDLSPPAAAPLRPAFEAALSRAPHPPKASLWAPPSPVSQHGRGDLGARTVQLPLPRFEAGPGWRDGMPAPAAAALGIIIGHPPGVGAGYAAPPRRERISASAGDGPPGRCRPRTERCLR